MLPCVVRSPKSLRRYSQSRRECKPPIGRSQRPQLDDLASARDNEWHRRTQVARRQESRKLKMTQQTVKGVTGNAGLQVQAKDTCPVRENSRPTGPLHKHRVAESLSRSHLVLNPPVPLCNAMARRGCHIRIPQGLKQSIGSKSSCAEKVSAYRRNTTHHGFNAFSPAMF